MCIRFVEFEFSIIKPPFYGSTPVSAIPGGTAYSTVTGIDLLGRTTEVTLQDGTKVETEYGQGTDFNYVTVTDQAGKQRRQLMDALGRVVRVDEPYTNGSLGTLASPAQPTYYEYDANDNLAKVTQSDVVSENIGGFNIPVLHMLPETNGQKADKALNAVSTKHGGGLGDGSITPSQIAALVEKEVCD